MLAAEGMTNPRSWLAIPTDMYPSEEDFLYEKEILWNPFTLKLW